MARATLPTLGAVIAAGASIVLGAGAGGASAHSCAKSGEFRIRAADGIRLAGHRFGRGPTAVVFAHERRGGACRWIPYARALAARGYLTIAFDFRGYGASQSPYGDAAFRQPADVTAMAKRARALFDATGSTSKRLEIVDSDDHGVDLLADRTTRATVEQ